MRGIGYLTCLSLLLTGTMASAQVPLPAGEVLNRAKAEAGEKHKKVFLVFGASW
jgi:hypothetical protein